MTLGHMLTPPTTSVFLAVQVDSMHSKAIEHALQLAHLAISLKALSISA